MTLYGMIDDLESWLGTVKPNCQEIMWAESYWEWVEIPGEGEQKIMTKSSFAAYLEKYVGKENVQQYMVEKRIVRPYDIEDLVAKYMCDWEDVPANAVYELFLSV